MIRTRKSRATGVTLIELVVAMAVLAILAMAALPAYRDFFERYRLRGAVDDVISVISTARSAAVKTDRDVMVSFGGSSTSWCVGARAAAEPLNGNPVGVAAACVCGTNSPECVVAGQTLRIPPGKHAGVSAGSVATSFTFDSKLGVIAPLGSVCNVFSSPNNRFHMQVNVNALGQTTTCVPSGEPIAGVTACSELGVAACP